MSRWKILAVTTALAAMVVAATASLPVCARDLQPLATAAPEQVGMSGERLGRITTMQDHLCECAGGEADHRAGSSAP
jgi:hypothetical protein